MEKSNASTDLAMIPFAAHEAAMERAEQHSKRWMTVFIITFAALVISNAVWLIR